MITPIIHEDVWLASLGQLAPFDSGHGPIVLVSPHPDDETLGAGGFLAAQAQRGRRITVLAVTDGENAYPDFDGLAQRRTREQERALLTLCGKQAQLVRLGFTDSSVAASEDRLIESLATYVAQDTHLVAPWHGDFHPDHEACGRAAAVVALKAGARLSWYFFWTWHRGTTSTLENIDLRFFAMNEVLVERKLSALQCHGSQLEYALGEPILPQRLLAPARRHFEVFADQ